ncbi:MAG: 3-methyl-2-oxobutanoate hydroxymethyltransferase [Gammaproteobacteria bacterium]|nr:3-methyl-2-oxobutanoate hydroxymethyltransferase [Gammaproteobacteria bacterium]
MITINQLMAMKQRGEKITCLTCYDASFSRLLERAGVELILVGDSLGMVLQGHDSTLPVTMDDMIYHARCVTRQSGSALYIVDLPYHSYLTVESALQNAQRLMEQGGAQMVKLEGAMMDVVSALVDQGYPVCAHLGLLPQSVNELGGYHVQGRSEEQAQIILDDAIALQQAGASLLVLECVPASLGKRISLALDIPVIGIGAGVDCDGQVLVLYDALGITPGKRPRFSKDFLAENEDIAAALKAYVRAVKDELFPAAEHSF